MGRGQMIPRGDRKWLLRVFLGRNPEGKKQYHSKVFEGTTAQARQELTSLLRSRDTKHLVAPSTMTMNQLVDAWLPFKQAVSKGTVFSYKKNLRLYIQPRLGAYKLSAITPTMIQEAYNAMVAEGLAARTVTYAHTITRQVFAWAVKMGYLGRNPCDDTERPRVQRRAPTVLTVAQMNTLFASQAHSPLLPLWMLFLNTGLRPGEALALTWDNFDGTSVSIRKGLKRNGSSYTVEDQPKTNKSRRTVTLPASALDALRVHRQRQAQQMLSVGPAYTRRGFIFATETGDHLHPHNVARAWATALKQAGLPKVRLYDTRHSHATALLSNGVNLAWVADRLGHEDIKLTRDTYAHVLPEAHKEMADVMENALRRAVQQ